MLKRVFHSILRSIILDSRNKIGSMKVWVDTSKDSVHVPVIDGEIRIKLLRLPTGVKPKKIKDHSPMPEMKQPVKPKTNTNHTNLEPQKEKSPHNFNSANSMPQKDPPPVDLTHQSKSANQDEPDLIGGFEYEAQKDEADLNMNFDIDPNEAFGEPAKAQDNNDDVLLNFDTQPEESAKPETPQDNGGFDLAGFGDLSGVNFNSEEKKEEEKKANENDIRKHVKEIHQKEEQEQVEWEDARRKHEQRIELWKGAHMKNSIKILLCTLHTVMWAGSKWEIIGMDKVEDPAQVKKLYRRAILITHPNKVNQSPTEQKFIANRVFAALNEAWKEFENTGN
mmetsp:Transcript_17354/g.17043  ORF Transcript_17354/g.17043 Transcript_17354/m.17043 type:complete len:337 (-) Transcript_17354:23-1033(-)